MIDAWAIYWTLSFSFQHVLYTYMVFRNATTRQKKHPFLVSYCNQRRNDIKSDNQFKFFKIRGSCLPWISWKPLINKITTSVNSMKQIMFVFLVLFYPDIINRICQKIDNPQTLPPTPVFSMTIEDIKH